MPKKKNGKRSKKAPQRITSAKRSETKLKKENGHSIMPSDNIEYWSVADVLNARLECVKCGRDIQGKSKAHLAGNKYEKTVCIPCFENITFGRRK